MFSITRSDYGFHLVFGGIMDAPELEHWLRESTAALQSVEGEFYVLVDMRTLGPLEPKGKLLMQAGQAMYRRAGMLRSVVILNNPVTLMQFKRIAHESGIFEWERYIDASAVPDWEPVAMSWLLHGVDPLNRIIRLKREA